MTADDIFYILEDGLHYPGIKQTIERLDRWEKKNLWIDLDRILAEEYDRGYYDGCYDGAREGKQNGYTLALQQLYDEFDNEVVKSFVLKMAEKNHVEIEQ